MIGVFLYLTGRSARNRFIRQLRRLRTPRYLIALLLGLLYLYAIAEQQRSARSGADPSAAQWVHLLAMLGVVGAVIWAWLFGSERRALVFSPADVTFLFAGPVTRRWLIQYKLLRSQLPVLFNVLLWTLLLFRGSSSAHRPGSGRSPSGCWFRRSRSTASAPRSSGAPSWSMEGPVCGGGPLPSPPSS